MHEAFVLKLYLQMSTHGAAALHQRSPEVQHGRNVGSLIGSLWTALNEAKGLSLAANQIGELDRVIVVHAEGFRQAIINPVIERRYGGQHTAREGCLSFPSKTALRVRDKQIVVSGFDENWKPISRKLKGLTARAVQHAIDNLDGVTIA